MEKESGKFPFNSFVLLWNIIERETEWERGEKKSGGNFALALFFRSFFVPGTGIPVCMTQSGREPAQLMKATLV